MCYQMTKSLQRRLIFYTSDVKNLPHHFWHNILIKPVVLNYLFIVSIRDYDMAPHYLIIPHNYSSQFLSVNSQFYTEHFFHWNLSMSLLLLFCAFISNYLFSPSPIIILFLFIFPITFFHYLSKLLTISWISPNYVIPYSSLFP